MCRRKFFFDCIEASASARYCCGQYDVMFTLVHCCYQPIGPVTVIATSMTCWPETTGRCTCIGTWLQLSCIHYVKFVYHLRLLLQLSLLQTLTIWTSGLIAWWPQGWLLRRVLFTDGRGGTLACVGKFVCSVGLCYGLARLIFELSALLLCQRVYCAESRGIISGLKPCELRWAVPTMFTSRSGMG